jgi:hypothetical protein
MPGFRADYGNTPWKLRVERNVPKRVVAIRFAGEVEDKRQTVGEVLDHS